MSRRLVPLVLAAGLGTAACGSTIQDVDGVTTAQGAAAVGEPSPGASGDASLAGPPVGDESLSGVGGIGSAPGSGNTVAPDGSIVAPDGTVVSPAPGTSAGSATQTVGVTATSIYIGITYSTGSDQLNRSLGNNITSGDQKADAQAVVDDINAHGGVAGRKLVPVWYDYQATDTRPYTTIDNEACAHFTQDNHVFAVAGDGITDNFPACIQKAGAMMVSSASAIIGPDQAYFNRFPYVFNTGYLTQDRMMAEQVRSLVRQDYFTGWNSATGKPGPAPAKIGILSFDTPSWNTPLDHTLLSGLESAGHPVDPANVQRVTYPSDTDQVGSSVAGIQAAVLKFRQNGVTHVIVLDAQGSLTLHMLNNMRSQHYYPRLGVNSASGVEVLATQYHEDSQSFNGAVGLGWAPILDLPEGQGDKYFTSATKDCISMVEKRTGQHFPDTNSASVALGECDQLYLLTDALNSAGGVVTRDGVSAAIEALRGRFPSAGTHGLYFSPTRHDGIEYGYDLRFDTACTCTKYAAGPFRIP